MTPDALELAYALAAGAMLTGGRRTRGIALIVLVGLMVWEWAAVAELAEDLAAHAIAEGD